MFTTFINALKVKEIRDRIIFTVIILAIIRIGCQIPVPGADSAVIESILSNFAGLDFFNAMTGSSFERFSIFTLNVTVYITASIIIQLMTIVIPKLEELQKDGQTGRKKITQITRWLTLGLALFESAAISIGFGRQGVFGNISGTQYWITVITTIIIMTGGAILITWMGELITERGIGNGISLILLVNILASMPGDFVLLYEQFIGGAKSVPMAILAAFIILTIFVGMIVFIVYLNNGERRVPVQYSQKAAQTYSYGVPATNIPIKVNTAGVIPIIFAASLFQMPVLIAELVTKGQPEWTRYLVTSYWFNPSNMIYTLGFIVYVALIIFFAYYYTQITFNPYDIASNMKKQGGMIPGIRPGKPTEEYLKKIMKYLIFIGAIALVIVAAVPIIVSGLFNTRLSFAGTSLIIVVSVIIETHQKIESMLLGRNYSGFLAQK